MPTETMTASEYRAHRAAAAASKGRGARGTGPVTTQEARTSHSASHTALVKFCLDWLAWEPRLKAWKANTGGSKFKGKDGKEYFVKFGVRGQSDIAGIIAPHGRWLAVECKTGTGRLTADQQAFREMIEAQGGVYLVVRCLSDLQKGIEEAFRPF